MIPLLSIMKLLICSVFGSISLKRSNDKSTPATPMKLLFSSGSTVPLDVNILFRIGADNVRT